MHTAYMLHTQYFSRGCANVTDNQWHKTQAEKLHSLHDARWLAVSEECLHQYFCFIYTSKTSKGKNKPSVLQSVYNFTNKEQKQGAQHS